MVWHWHCAGTVFTERGSLVRKNHTCENALVRSNPRIRKQLKKMGQVERLSLLITLLAFVQKGWAIQCYQCDSNEDMSCKSYEKFDTEINAPVDCNSFEANTPGQFCMKIVQESPGWRGWKKITRRCGSRTDLGVAWGCRWSWDTVGVFKEICYCESDRCNTASFSNVNMTLLTITALVGVFIRKFL